MEKINPDLLSEVVLFMKENYCYLEPLSINEETRIEDDLKMIGDEAYEFFVAYGKRFGVDVSNFMFADYFSPEGCDFITPILVTFKLKKETIRKPFIVAYLVKGIEAGKLDEEVIDSYR